VRRDVFGELALRILFATAPAPPTASAAKKPGAAADVDVNALAEKAAAGWGGDRVVVLSRPGDRRLGRAVGIARTEWDTEADAIEAAEATGKALADLVVGGTVDRTATRIRLFGIDGTVSWLERKGPSLVIVLGAPAWSAAALAGEVWTATGVARPGRPVKPAR